MDLIQINLQRKLEGQFLDRNVNKLDFVSYYKLYGLDDFLKERYDLLSEMEPSVLLISIGNTDSEIETLIEQQRYSNLTVKKIMDITSYDIAQSELVCFVEENHSYDSWKIVDMAWNLMFSKDPILICYRDEMTDDGALVKDISWRYWRNLQDDSFLGKDLIELCVSNDVNLYGDLSTLMCRSKLMQNVINKNEKNLFGTEIGKIKLLYELLLQGNVRFLNKVYVIKRLKLYDEKKEKQCFREFMQFLSELRLRGLEVNWNNNYQGEKVKLKKKITFFNTDSSEHFNLQPIAKVAEEKGYSVKFSDDLFEKAEIGVYCQHIPHPENSKFSIILLHDMAQRHDIWPNLWKNENWDQFDIGILPGEEWRKRWALCASSKYARPGIGTFELGYPKGDMAFSQEILEKAKVVKDKFIHEFTVLYAPSWENDHKEDDFVSALKDLPINLLVKQVPLASSSRFDFVRDNIREMRELHDNKYENLYYIEPDENIMIALAAADIVVSDESSVMFEAAMYGIPSIAITDWLIPDRSPSRYACVPMENVVKCTKSELKQMIFEMIEDQEKYEQACELGKKFFTNKGNCCNDIIDLLDAVIEHKEIPSRIAEKRVVPQYEPIELWS